MTRLPLALSLVLVACSFSVRTGSGTAATEARSLDSAESLHVGGGIDVEVMSGFEDTSVEITCDDNLLDDIVTEVDDGHLVIRPTVGVTLQPRTACVVRVAVDNLESVDVSGSSDVYVGGRPLDGLTHLGMSGSGSLSVSEASGCDMTVGVSGSGAVEVDELLACAVEVSVSGSGRVDLSGSADAVDSNLSGSGAVRVATLVTPRADIDVSGSGEVDAFAALRARVRISGSGIVRLFGDPGAIDAQVSGSGELVRE